MLRALLKLRVGLRGPGWRYEAHSLRSEAKHNICRLIYHSAHLIPLLSLPASFVSTLVHHRRLCYHGLLFISELKVRIIQAVLAALANLVREISFVLNPKHRHIKLRNEKILQFCVNIFPHFISLQFYIFLQLLFLVKLEIQILVIDILALYCRIIQFFYFVKIFPRVQLLLDKKF